MTEYKYAVQFKIEVKRLDGQMLTDEENEMVKKMQTATEEAIAKVMNDHGNNVSQNLGRIFEAY